MIKKEEEVSVIKNCVINTKMIYLFWLAVFLDRSQTNVGSILFRSRNGPIFFGTGLRRSLVGLFSLRPFLGPKFFPV